MFGLPDEFTPGFLARLEKLRIRTRQRYAGLGRGMHLSPKRGSSLEFNDFRHYSPGDDFRYIDWGLYGRSDKLYIKLFQEEEDLLTYIFVDASASMAIPRRDRKFEARDGDGACAGIRCARRRRPRDAARAGRQGREASIRRSSPGGIGSSSSRGGLPELRPAGQFDFANSLATELFSIRRAGKVFIVSDFLMLLNSVTRGLGMFTAASMDLTAVQILGGRELNGQGLDGDVEVVDSESGERLRVSIGERERSQYRETMTAPDARDQIVSA